MYLKVSTGKWRPFWLDPNMIIRSLIIIRSLKVNTYYWMLVQFIRILDNDGYLTIFSFFLKGCHFNLIFLNTLFSYDIVAFDAECQCIWHRFLSTNVNTIIVFILCFETSCDVLCNSWAISHKNSFQQFCRNLTIVSFVIYLVLLNTAYIYFRAFLLCMPLRAVLGDVIRHCFINFLMECIFIITLHYNKISKEIVPLIGNDAIFRLEFPWDAITKQRVTLPYLKFKIFVRPLLLYGTQSGTFQVTSETKNDKTLYNVSSEI